MKYEDGPHEVNDTFELPIEALLVDLSRCMGGNPSAEDVHQMAVSLGTMGQLQNVLVVWRGQAYELVVGYTRALAIQTCGDAIGIKTIRAMRIAAIDEDRARLAENFVRRNRGTFETAKYFSELYEGHDRKQTPIPHLAVITGKSEQYVRGLLRLFRELPPQVKAAWEADRDQRFTFHRLNELVQLKQAGNEAALNGRLQEILVARSKRRGAADHLGYKTAEQSLAEALEGCGLVRQPDGNLAPSLRAPDEREKHRIRRLSRRQLERLEARLAAVGSERLTSFTVAGDTFHRFVLALLGKVPRSEAWSIIDRFADDDDEPN